MSRVVYDSYRETEYKVDRDNRQNAALDLTAEELGDFLSISECERSERAEQSEYRAGCAGGGCLRIKCVTADRTDEPGDQVKDYKTSRAIDSFDLLTDDPQGVVVQQQMNYSDVNEDRCYQSPVLMLTRDQTVLLRSKTNQHRRVRRGYRKASGEAHQHKYSGVDADEDHRERIRPGEKRLQKPPLGSGFVLGRDRLDRAKAAVNA